MPESYVNKPKCAFYDLETTGLNWYHDQIIEVAAELDGKKFSHLCNTNGKKLATIITNLTGISDDMLVNAPKESRVLKDFCYFIGRTRSPVYLIAHNNEHFDRWFLKSRTNKKLVRLPSSWRYVDSLLLAKLVYPHRTSYSLYSLCKDLGVEQIQAHRAGDDVRCLREIFIIMAKYYNTLRNLKGNWDDNVEQIWNETQCI